METVNLLSMCVAHEINVPKLSAEKLKNRMVLKWEEPLELSLEDGRVLVFPFGSLVFVESSRATARAFLDSIKDYLSVPLVAPPEEEFRVSFLESEPLPQDAKKIYGGEEAQIFATEDGIICRTRPMFHDGIIKTCALALAQSVALERIEDFVDSLEDEVENLIASCRKRSPLLWSMRKITDGIFNTLSAHKTAISDLMILDIPDIAWEHPHLEAVYEHLRRSYELVRRFRNIERSLEFVLNSGRLLAELADARRQMLLETLIVILILVEIIFPFWFWH